MDEQEIIGEVKSLLPYVVKYQEKKGYVDFDYGYLYTLNVWECTFFDKEDKQMERFVGTTKLDIIQQLT